MMYLFALCLFIDSLGQGEENQNRRVPWVDLMEK